MQAQSKYFTVAPPFDYDNNRGKRIRARCNVQLRDGSMKCRNSAYKTAHRETTVTTNPATATGKQESHFLEEK